MLRSISILNYTLIEELTVDLQEGLNVITGETGAGKSIIIDAISLLLGERASKDNLRIGADKMVVSALFDPPNVRRDPKVGQLLDDAGVNICEELIISREMDKRGRSVCRVNGIIVPVSLLKALGPHLMDIHGQHEHASLFKAENHRILLDAYAGERAKTLLEKLSESAQTLRKIARKIRELESSGRETQRQIEFDRFALNEIEKAELVPDEEESLRDEKKKLQHSEQLYEDASRAKMILSDEGDQMNLLAQLSEVSDAIGSLAEIDPYFESFSQTIQSCYLEMENLSQELSDYSEAIEFSPQKLEAIETRLNQIENLEKKYGENIEAVLDYARKIAERLEENEFSDEKLDQKKKDYIQNRKQYSLFADELHQLRQDISQTFKQELEGELKDLAMEKARVEVKISKDEDLISSHGKDDVEFLISVNPGVPPKPIQKIASGGEISRIMLSLKCIFGERDHTDTMVFDEIDTGISGRTAQSVAEKISRLSRSHQIICITHLPQIAAMADRHFLVEKDSDSETVSVSFQALDEVRRTDELARMLGGAKVTDTTREHAREMLAQSEQIRKNS